MIRPRPPYVRRQRTEVEAGGPRSRSGRNDGKNICPCKKSNPQPRSFSPQSSLYTGSYYWGYSVNINKANGRSCDLCTTWRCSIFLCRRMFICTTVQTSRYETCGGMQINLHSFLTWVSLLLCIREVRGSNFGLEIGIQFRVSRDLFSHPVHDRILPINWKYRDSTKHILGYWERHYISSSPNVIKRLNKILWDGKSLCQMWERKEMRTKFGRENWREKVYFENLGVDGTKIFKWILRK